jgi:hypothetical protein
MDNLPDKPRGVLSKQALFQKASYHAPRAIEVLVEAMEMGENYAVKTGAAKALLSKCLPDLKSTDFSDSDGKSLIEKIIIVKAGDEDSTLKVAG